MFEKNKDLSSLTTFGLPAKARLFAEYASVKELTAISRSQEYLENEVLHIGGGSNLLFVRDFDGLVLHSAIRGIRRYDKNQDTVYAIAGAGEKWIDFVEWTLSEGLSGAENLAGIPGEVGAAPVQNVGAYGVEAKDIIHHVECFDTVTRRTVVFTAEECGMTYRDSRFKHEWKGRYYVLRVSFCLRPSDAATSCEYGVLKELTGKLGHKPTPREVANEVLAIRSSKLPDPAEIGSAGSFFKNPVVSRYYFEQQMLALYPDIPSYPMGEHWVKVPAGWLIEHAGLKGKRIGGAEVYPSNCLVIANRGNATADDVIRLSDTIVDKVMRNFAVVLQPEVNFIDTAINVTILGCGTSKGVPEVACRCRVCTSGDPRDKRLRASALIRTHGMTILLDASPDFREQALREGLTDIDAVLLTHSHYDHVGGIDDLRPFCAHRNVPIYLQKDVNDDLHKRLDYCFRPHLYPGVPTFDMHEIDYHQPFYINGLKIIPIRIMHGQLPILGYRIGDFAYITDAKSIPEEEMEKLMGLKVLVVNALREREHFAHMSFAEAFELIKRLKPEEAYITHTNHESGLYTEMEAKFPEHVHPAYDGLRLTVN